MHRQWVSFIWSSEGDQRGGTLARAFALNATGSALIMKHVLPLLPRRSRAEFASLSARVGSIGDIHTTSSASW
jgi:hypothetical protein